MKNLFKLLSLVLIASMTFTGCSHDSVYDTNYQKEQYEASFAAKVLHGGTIDPSQTWNASEQSKLIIKLNLDAEATYRVCAFTDNPLTSSTATLLDQETAKSGSSVTLYFAKPIGLITVYIAAINAKNRYDVYTVTMEGAEGNATIGGTEQTRTRAVVNGVSTASSTYIKEYSYFKAPEYVAGSYYDLSTIETTDLSQIDVKLWNPTRFKYGDGLHYYIPEGKTIKANINYTNTTAGESVIYVAGTWEIPNSYKLTNGRQIVVAPTGKIILDGTCEFNSGARFINRGSISTTNGYLIFSNKTASSIDFYNSGVMEMNDGGINVAGNSSPLYNIGTYTARFIDVNGEFTFTNFGVMTVGSTNMKGKTLSDQANSASNFTLINGCHASIDAMGVHNLILCDNSRIDCTSGIFTGGGNKGISYLGRYAVVNAGDWHDNGGTIYGSSSSEEASVFKFAGNLTVDNKFTTSGYVYYDGDFSQKTSYSKNTNWWISQMVIPYTTSEATTTLIIPSGTCTGAGYNPNNESGKGVVTTPTTYYYAYEDMGSIGDYDFNDVVIGVDYPVMNGTDKTAVFKVYAAGGTLPVAVKYGSSTICQDVHTALGVATGTMVNTGNIMTIDPVAIHTQSGITGTFDASNLNISIVVNNNNASTEISPDVQSGQVPQMIKVPSPWRWAREQINIGDAYTSFGAWGCNYLSNKTWYQNSDSGKVTAPK